MDTNLLKDVIKDYLVTKHPRIYKDNTPSKPIFPYGVFLLENSVPLYPGLKISLLITMHDKRDASSSVIEEIVDSIDGDGDLLYPTGLNNKIINTDQLNLQFQRDPRQTTPASEIVGTQSISIRYSVTAYSK